jgi:hypothetical protein
MNTKGLAKHYGGLTPWERLPLILAASARGDELERDRLARSAPEVVYRVRDHFGLAMAYREVSQTHYMELLHLAGNYLAALALAETWEEGKHTEKMRRAALALGYVFGVSLAGWRRFCQEHHLEPEAQVCWACLPGFDTVRWAEAEAERAAFGEEGAARWLDETGGGQAVKVPTAEDVAAGLREALKARAEWWG